MYKRQARGEPPRVFEDGGQRRNFVHVDDVAAAVVTALEAASRGGVAPGVTPLNIGSPDVTTVGRMAEVLSEELHGPAPVVTGQFRLGDVRHITADCTAAERVLGWRAVRPLSSIAELAVTPVTPNP